MRNSLKWAAVTILMAEGLTAGAVQAGPRDAMGLWMTLKQDAVVEFKPCGGKPSSLCGRIVWDRDAGTSTDTCGVKVAQLNEFDGDAWHNGWVYDPRDKKNYKGKITADGGTMTIRAFLGVEALGQSESLRRVSSMPSSPVCRR